MSALDAVLGPACLLAAVASVAVYLWLLVRRSAMIRLMTSLGLFLTGLALFQGPNILAQTPEDANVRLAMAALLLAVGVQLVAALRTRPAWSGVDRRAPRAEGPASP
jgi:hypothetical protein